MNPLLVIQAIAAIASIVGNLVNVFSTKIDEAARFDRIDQELTIIQTQLSIIDQKMDLVLNALSQFAVEVHQNFVAMFRVPVETAVVLINQNFKTWSKGWNPRDHPLVPRPEEVFRDLHKTTTSLELIGFAGYSTVGLALVYELAMLKLPSLRSVSSTDLKPGFEAYKNYFEAAIDITKDGSIGKQKVNLEEDAQHIIDDIQARQPLLWNTGAVVWVSWVDGLTHRTTARIAHSIGGTLADGFNDTLQERFVHTGDPIWTVPDGGGERGSLMTDDRPINAQDLLPSNTNISSSPVVLNQNREVYVQKLDGIQIAGKALDAILPLITLSRSASITGKN
jgi:hypothetical protein